MELLTVISIIAILAAVSMASLQGITGASSLTKQASDLSDIFAQARTYAMGNNTYVYVGIEEVSSTGSSPGVGQVAVAVVSATGGTRPYGNSPGALSGTGSSPVTPIMRTQVFNNLHIASSTDLTNGAMGSRPSSSTAGFVDLGAPSTKSTATFQWPLSGSALYNFSTVVEFSPQGTPRVQMTSSYDSTLPSYIELPLLPTHGAVTPSGSALATANEAALQIDGVTGIVEVYRP